jgi:hypothetical protein
MATTTRSSGGSKSSPISRSALRRAGGNLINAVLRRADIKTINIDSLDANSLTVDELSVGNATVENIALSNVQTRVDTGRAFLNNVRTIVNLDISVEWQVNLLFTSPSDSFRLGSFPIPFTVGDIEISDLDNIDVSVPTAEVNETVVSIPPVSNLSFNGGVISDISVSDVQMPVDGYGLSGLAFDTFSLSHIGVPDAGIASVSIGSIEPNGNITLPGFATDVISIADVQVPSVQSNSPISVNNAIADDREITLINIGLLRVSIVIKPSIDMNIESLTMEEIEATSTIDSVSLQNIQFPFKATGVQMTGVGANQLRAEEVSL